MQLPNHEGRKVPAVVFHTRSGDAWVDVTTDELFAGKRVVVSLAVPSKNAPHSTVSIAKSIPICFNWSCNITAMSLLTGLSFTQQRDRKSVV